MYVALLLEQFIGEVVYCVFMQCYISITTLNTMTKMIIWVKVNGSHEFYYKVPYQKSKTGIDYWGCNVSQVRLKGFKGDRNKFFFWFLDDNLIEKEWIALKLCHKVPYSHRKFWIDFAGFDWNHLRITAKKWPFGSTQIFIPCQISNGKQNSKLCQVWMVCPYLPPPPPTVQGSTSAVISSYTLQIILFMFVYVYLHNFRIYKPSKINNKYRIKNDIWSKSTCKNIPLKNTFEH